MDKQNWKRNTVAFMASQAISLFGSSLVQFAITWYITLTTQSGVYMTISIICGFVPTLILSPFAGVWADRYDRKKLIMFSDGAIALSTLVLAIVFLTGYKPIWLLFAVSALRALGSAVQSPSINAMLPDMVPEDQLMRINGINGSLQSLLTLVSPALAGALLTATGSIELLFFLDVITAAIAIVVMLRFLKLPVHVKKEGKLQGGYFGEIRQGLSYIRKHNYLLHMFVFIALINFAAAPIAFLTPLQTVRSYGDEYWRLTALEITFSAGMLLGGLLISTWGGLKNRIHTIVLALGIMGVTTVLMGSGVSFWVYLAMLVLSGFSMPLANTPAITLLQEKVDSAYIGRVFSVVSMISSCVMPLSMVIFGPLADRIAIEWILVGTGIAFLALAGIMLMDRTAVAIGKREEQATSETISPAK